MFEVMSSGGNLITHRIKSNINKPVIAVKNHNSPEQLKFMNTWERLLNHFYPNNLIVDISINNIHIIVMHIIIINNMHSGNSLGTKTESCLPLLLEVQPISAKENKSHSWIQTHLISNILDMFIRVKCLWKATFYRKLSSGSTEPIFTAVTGVHWEMY